MTMLEPIDPRIATGLMCLWWAILMACITTRFVLGRYRDDEELDDAREAGRTGKEGEK